MSLIKLNNITKQYDSKPVLRDVYFRLSKGDKVRLIGKNGTGKTTLLKLILGQEDPIEGIIEVFKDVKIGYFS